LIDYDLIADRLAGNAIQSIPLFDPKEGKLDTAFLRMKMDHNTNRKLLKYIKEHW